MTAAPLVDVEHERRRVRRDRRLEERHRVPIVASSDIDGMIRTVLDEVAAISGKLRDALQWSWLRCRRRIARFGKVGHRMRGRFWVARCGTACDPRRARSRGGRRREGRWPLSHRDDVGALDASVRSTARQENHGERCAAKSHPLRTHGGPVRSLPTARADGTVALTRPRQPIQFFGLTSTSMAGIFTASGPTGKSTGWFVSQFGTRLL